MSRVYDEIVDFVAGIDPAEVAAFEASPATRQKVAELIAREKAGELAPDETAELNHFLEIEHLMRLAKARARQRLAHHE